MDRRGTLALSVTVAGLVGADWREVISHRESRSGMLAATSLRTTTCRRSPGSTRVEPRGSTASLPRTITLTNASRGRFKSRTRRPAMASSSTE